MRRATCDPSALTARSRPDKAAKKILDADHGVIRQSATAATPAQEPRAIDPAISIRQSVPLCNRHKRVVISRRVELSGPPCRAAFLFLRMTGPVARRLPRLRFKPRQNICAAIPNEAPDFDKPRPAASPSSALAPRDWQIKSCREVSLIVEPVRLDI